MKKYFKLGLAVALTILTGLCVIAANTDWFNAIGGKLGAVMCIFCTILTFAVALPCWLMIITNIQKTQPYLRFKNWCIYQYHDILRAE